MLIIMHKRIELQQLCSNKKVGAKHFAPFTFDLVSTSIAKCYVSHFLRLSLD
jgi:hypothetical protein